MDDWDDEEWLAQQGWQNSRAQEPMRGRQKVRTNPSQEDRKVRNRNRRATAGGDVEKRAELVRALGKTSNFQEQVALLDQIRKLDEGIRAQAAQGRELDFADTVVRETMTPVSTFQHHTAATDWLGDASDVDPQWQNRVVAEAAMWFGRVPEFVKADREEFGIQAQGMARRVAGQFGIQATAAQKTFMDYVGFLYKQAASGLDQIQQTVDPNNQPKTTPLPTETFDNFAPEVDPINAGVSGTETSDRAPLIQEIVNGGSGMDGGAPEKPGGHSTDDELSWAPPEGMQQDTAPGWSDGDPGAPEKGGDRPDYSKQSSLYGGPGMAIGYTMNMDEFRAKVASQKAARKAGGQGKGRKEAGKPLASRKHAGPNDPSQRMIDRMQAIGDPHKEGYAYLQDGGILCPGCSAKRGGEDAAGPHKPLSWSDLRHHYPHGVTCDDCMQELTEERPHEEHECQYGEDCPYAETYDANDSHVPEGQHHDWGGDDDFKTTLMEHQDWQNRVNQRDKDAGHAEKAINDLFSGPEWGQAKDFLHNNPGGATFHSKKRTQAASGLPMIQETVDANNQPHAPTPIPPDVAFPLDEEFQPEWTTNGTGNAQPSQNVQTPPSSHQTAKKASHGCPDCGGKISDGKCSKCGQECSCAQCKKAKTAGFSEDYAKSLKDRHQRLVDQGQAGARQCTVCGQNKVTDPSKKICPECSGKSGRSASRKQADMFGNSDTPHAVPQQEVANNPSTTPPTAQNAGGAAAGRADAQAGNAPTFGDDSAYIPTPAEQYPEGYVSGAPSASDPDVPASMAGPGNGVTRAGSKVSSLIVTAAERENADFKKGYGYASKWTPGTRLVSTGSKEFEAGVYAGISDNPEHQRAFVQAHRAVKEKFPKVAARVEQHVRVTHRVAAKNEHPSNGLYLTASTSMDLNTMAPNTTPAADGSTPINGPGRPGPLDGQQDAAAPGGPAPYNGAPPYGSPVVPGSGQAPAEPNPADALIGGGHMSTPNQVMGKQSLAFRKRVQAGLLAERQGK